MSHPASQRVSRQLRALFLMLAAVLIPSIRAFADTINVPADHPTLQEACAAASSGDVILLAPGTYQGGVFIENKTLTIASQFFTTGDTSFIARTVIWGVVDYCDGTSPNCRGDAEIEFGKNAHGSLISGLTVRDSVVGLYGKSGHKGVRTVSFVDIDYCKIIYTDDGVNYDSGSGGTISNSLFARNHDDGIDFNGKVALRIINNFIRDNRDDGIELRLSGLYDNKPLMTTEFIGNRITGNREDGIQFIDNPDTSSRAYVVRNNYFSKNNMAGIGVMHDALTNEDFSGYQMPERILLQNNTFVNENFAVSGGGNIIALNNVFVGTISAAMWFVGTNSIASYNLFWNNTVNMEGTNADMSHTLLADPMLADNGTLTPGSPAINAGVASYVWHGEPVLDLPPTAYTGTAPDLGWTEYSATTGTVPSLIITNATVPELNSGSQVAQLEVKVSTATHPAITVNYATVDGSASASDSDYVATAGTLNIPANAPSGFIPVTVIGDLIPEDTESFSVKLSNPVNATLVRGTGSCTITNDDGAAPSLTGKIATSADDAEQQYNGVVLLDDVDIDLMLHGSHLCPVAGLRYAGLEIPRGAKILNASLQFKSSSIEVGTLPATLSFRGEAVDHALPFTAATNSLSLLPGTAAEAVWSVPAWGAGESGSAERTPNLKNIIQEVVDRPGWSSGNALGILITGSGMRVASSYDGGAPPVLRVMFSTDSLVNQPPLVDAGPDTSVSLTGVASLHGSVRDDGLPAPATRTFQWSVRGPGAVTFDDAHSLAPRVTFNAMGTYVLDLMASDGALASHDSLRVTVVAPPPIVESRIAAGGDDTEELTTGVVSATATKLCLMTDGSKLRNAVGLRFTGLAIPPGANIVAAWIQFSAKEAQTDVTSLMLQGEAADNAPPFATTTGALTTLPKTTAQTAWPAVPAWVLGATGPEQRSADVRDIVQEIVSRPGWRTGNAIALLVTGTGRRTPTSFESGTGKGALLHVEITMGPIVNQAPTVNAGADTLVANTGAAYLRGRASDDGFPRPPALRPRWTQVGGPGVTAFDDPSAFATRAVFSALGAYRLELLVSDGALEKRDTVDVRVVDASQIPITVESRIATGTDDGEESTSGSVVLTGSKLGMMLDGSAAQRAVALRFRGLLIPPGANIVSAWIQFKAKEAQSDVTHLILRGVAADSARALGTGSGALSTLPLTANQAAWTNVPAWAVGLAGPEQQSPELRDVLQEIVSRPGWRSGNALALVVSGTGHRTSTSFESSTGDGALLHLVYTTGPVPNRAPLVSAGPDTTVMNTGAAWLHGTAQDDRLPMPSTLTARWSQVSGPGAVTFDNPAALITRATFGAVGAYRLELMVSDGELQGRDVVDVNVLDPSRIPTVIESRVAASTDDAEEGTSGSVSLSSSDLDMLIDGSTVQRAVGIRFANLAIPPGASVTGAWIQFTAKEAQADPTTLTIRGHAIDNAPTFTTASANVTGRPSTAATAVWTSPPAWVVGQSTPAQRTADLAPVIREIVSRPGWASGNAIAFVITGTGHRVGYAFDGAAASAPVLHVEFLTGPVPNRAPVVNAGPDTTVMNTGAALLHGSAVDDRLPAPPALTARWSRVSGPGTVTFDNPQALLTRATFGAVGSYRLELQVSDGELAGRDSLDVNVIDPSRLPTVVESRVAASSDDAEEGTSGSVSLSSSDLDMMIDGSTLQRAIGIRFANLALPPGVTITGAWIQFTAKEAQADPTTLTIRGQAADNAPTFTSTSGNVTGRPVTSAAATWANPPAWVVGQSTTAQRTSDLAPVLQEIVSRPGWASGNAAAFVITGTGHRDGYAFDSGVATAALLHVEYVTRPVVVPNQAPFVSAGPDTTVGPGGAVFLRGLVTDDGLPAPAALTIQWRQVGGPGPVTFQDAHAPRTRATFAGNGTYRLELMASDGELETRDSVEVTVSNHAPFVSAGPDTAVGSPGVAFLRGVVVDDGLPAPPALTIQWRQVSGPGPVTFEDAHAPRTKATFAGTGRYRLELMASDGDLETRDSVDVNVVNHAPLVSAGPDTTVGFPGVALLRGAVQDDGLPAPPALTIQWRRVSGPDSVAFEDPHAPRTRATFRALGTYRLELLARDGELETRDSVDVTVASRPPVAALTVSAAVGVAPLLVRADATGSSGAGDSLSYRFDFGDGTVVGPQRVPVAAHVYAGGHWTLTLVTTDAFGVSDTTRASITVYANFVRNPSAEASVSGWVPNGPGAALARVAGGHDGNFCIEARGDSSLSAFGINDSPNWVNTVAAAGAHYRFTAWVRSDVNHGMVQLRVREYLGGVQQGAMIVSTPTELGPTWKLLTLDVTTLTAGSTLDFLVIDKPGTTKEVFQVDDVAIWIVPDGSALVTGSLPGMSQTATDRALAFGARLYPNPPRERATLELVTTRAGFANVRVYDAQGRVVRTLLDQRSLAPGRYAIEFQTRDAGGRLGPGMYFYSVRTTEGRLNGRFTVLE